MKESNFVRALLIFFSATSALSFAREAIAFKRSTAKGAKVCAEDVEKI